MRAALCRGETMRTLMSTLGGKEIANLQESDFNNLQIETEDPGGFTIASFGVPARIDLPHDYQGLIPARIDEGASVAFDGFVAPADPAAGWGASEQGFDFALCGWMQQLVDSRTHGIYLDAGEKASTLIADWIHGGVTAESPDKGDPRLQIVLGDIQTTDLVFDSPKYWESASWREILDDLNKANLWSWGVYEGRSLFWRPRSETVEYYIRTESTNAKLDSGLEDVCDLVMFVYRPAFGSDVSYGYHPATGWDPSLDRVHRTHLMDGTGNMGYADAAAVAEAYYDYYSVPHIKGPITCTAVTNSLGAEVPLWSVRAGSLACLVDYKYWDILDSFYIKHTTYNHDAQTLVLERENISPRLERMLARIGGNQ